MTDTVERRRTESAVSLPPWLGLARIAALVVTGWAIVLQILAGHLIPPVALVGAGFALMAGLLRRPSRWTGLMVAGAATLALVGNAPVVVEQFTRPASGPEFILNTIVTSSGLVVILSGMAAFRAWPTRPIRHAKAAWMVTVTAGAVIAFVASAGVESVQPASGDIQVAAEGVAFDRDVISVPAGRVAFFVDNHDPFHHTFTIRGTDQQIDLPALSAQRGEFELQPGVYEVFCDILGHENMVIELLVEG